MEQKSHLQSWLLKADVLARVIFLYETGCFVSDWKQVKRLKPACTYR